MKIQMSKFNNNRIFVLNNPHAPRLCPELAVEIGLTESIILLQLEFLIAVSNHQKDGSRWTYQSLNDLKQMFPFWSINTINNAIHTLESSNLIKIGNYNQSKYDRTRWFTIDYEGIRKLKSIQLASEPLMPEQALGGGCGTTLPKQPPVDNGHLSNLGNGFVIFNTTIPETTTETTDTIAEVKNTSAFAGEKPPAKRHRNDKELAIDKLSQFFSDQSGIPIEPNHKARNKLWRGPLGRLFDSIGGDVPKAQTVISQAIGKMRGDDLTFSDPNSIYKVAVSLLPAINGNGGGATIIITDTRGGSLNGQRHHR